MAEPALEFTGERFTPECVREIWYEHWHRYAFALRLAAGKRVLDAACGEGYGSALLSRRAASVLGVDISPQATQHAGARYAARNLRFETADVSALDHLPSGSFDLIVSFETLEHLQPQERMLDGFARLLADDGLLLVSTPDKQHYTDATGFTNEHHVRELYRDEFEAMLSARFAAHKLYAQKLVFQSALWALDGPGTYEAATLRADGTFDDTLAFPSMYYVAVCAKRADALRDLPALSLFGDAEESVYAHYNAEVRKNIAAGHRILELEAQLAALQKS